MEASVFNKMKKISRAWLTTIFYELIFISGVFCQSSVPPQSKTEAPITLQSSDPQTLKIWNGVAPGSETWTQEQRVIENTPVGTVVFNVVTPT